MFDKYSKRNTKSMSNKRNCLKHLFLISLIALIFASCSPSSNRISETASVRVETNQKGLTVASILPTEPTIMKYKVELFQNDTDSKYKKFFNPSESIILEDVKIGTYNLEVTGYSKFVDDAEDGNIEVVKGRDRITVYPESGNENTNHFNITLSYLSQGEGAISIIISWNELTATGNLIDDAIKKDSLGFIALKADGNVPLKGNLTEELIEENIQWADVEKGSMVYEEDGLDANKTGEEIYFRIYSEIDGELVVIAETFSTVLQVYPNLTSVPDVNDKYNFSLSNDNIIGYLRNVTNAKAEATSDTALNITWTNPTFSESIYPITVIVTAKSNQSGTEVKADPITYENAEASKAEGKVTIDGLNSNNTYTIYFQIKGAVGYSANTAMISNARPRIPVSKISFDTTDMDSFRFIEGTKDKVIKAIIEPEDATVQTYVVSEKANNENVVISGHNVTFNKAGEYTLVITSDDATAAPAEQQVIIYLPTPSKPEITSKNENGIQLSWDAVENATGYTITRESSKGGQVTFKSETNSCNDTTAATGNNYTYKVKATLNDDSRFDSADSEPSESVNIDQADINITIEDIPSQDFSSIFDQYNGTIINSENPELTINLTESIPDATNYKWVLDSKNVLANGDFDNAHSIEISSSTQGMMDTYESSHQLTLFVTINDTIYSGTLNFFYSDPSAATNVEITRIHTEDNNTRIIYGTAETFIADFKDNISGNVRWSSSNPDILYIDPVSGIAEAKTKGKVDITATLIADESKKYTLQNVESYIPIESITINKPARDYMITTGRTGVEILDTSLTTIELTGNIKAVNGVENGYSDKIVWVSDNPSIVKIEDSAKGVLTPGTSGVTTVKIQAFDGEDITKESESNVTIYALNANIKLIDKDNNTTTVTGGTHTVSGVKQPTYTLSLSFDYAISTTETKDYFSTNNWANTGFINYWCFDINNINDKDREYILQHLTITESSDYTGKIKRESNIKTYTVYAVIKLKDSSIAENNQKTVMYLSFSAKP